MNFACLLVITELFMFSVGFCCLSLKCWIIFDRLVLPAFYFDPHEGLVCMNFGVGLEQLLL